MIRFVHYFKKTIISSVKGVSHKYLLKTFMANSKYLTPQFLEDNNKKIKLRQQF